MQEPDRVVAVDRWRDELLTTVLRSVFVLGVLAAIPTVVFAFEAARFDIVLVDLVGLLVVGTVTFVTSPAYRLRAIVLLVAIYVLGLFLLMTVGAVGLLYLVALPVMAALLLGMWGAVMGLAVDASTLTVVGIVAALGGRRIIQGVDGGLEWALVSINLLFVSAVMAVTCALLLRRVERSLADEQALSASLATERAELRGSVDRLARSEEIRVAFLRATSHELRTPLTSIVGFIETVQRRDGDLPASERAHLIDRVAVNARRLHGLITDLLDVDRLSSGLVSANRQPHDLSALVLRALEEVELTDREVVADLEPMVVAVDAPKIERVVINLVANAARHCGPGGAVWIRLTREADSTVLQVSDDGPGVAPDYLEQIFEPFVQGPERHHDAKPGTGLGLSLARELVRLHGGVISATNRSPQGACFEVRLPDQ